MRPRSRLSLVLVLLASGCSSAPAPVAAGEGWEAARVHARSGDADAALAALEAALVDAPAVQRALLEPAFAASGLRDTPEFRRLVHDAAVRHAVAHLTLAPPDEPGEWIEVEGWLVDRTGDPVPGGVVRVFATAADGRYHPVLDGERVPRLFGTLVADADGRFVFRTVRPGPYPGTRDARHVHVSARAGDRRLAVPHYAVFDDDPLLDEPQNAEQRGEAVRVEMRIEDGEARGRLVLPLR